jgi:hypothetical protein
MRALVLLAVALVALGTAGQASASRAFALGDSVMLGAKPQLEKRGIHTDAAVSRQFSAGVAVLDAKRAPRGRFRSGS